jgi:hypothetical protein
MDRDKAIRAAKLTAKQVSSHKAADRVAELLRQGRAKEVTNDLMDQADPQRLHHHYVSGNTGVDMPMDKDSRMERAAQMGFDTKAYHGTNTSQEFSSLGKSVNSKRRESYLAPEEHKDFSNSFASSDQGRVFPLLANVTGFHNGRTEEGREALKDLAYEKNFQPELYANHLKGDPNTLRPVSWGDQNAIDKLNDAGYPGAVIEERPWMDSYAVFDPTKLRSQFARFDPRLSHLSHLSASTGGAMELARHATAVGRAGGQVSPSKYLPDVPRAVHADGGSVTDNENFQNWFGDSVTHTDGQPHVFYTGTSKDKDFTSHNVGRHGAWFVRDPEVASQYAEQNDSQGYKRDGFTLTPTNTASRVIPAYVKAENPYTGELPEEYLRDNYKAAQSEWFDTLRAKGHDSWIPSSQGGNLVVALKEPQQIKSIYNSGKFDPNQKHMNKADGGPAMFEGIHPDLQGEGGAPLDLYHGTTQDKEFEAFDDAKLGARDAGFYGRGHYLTPEKEIADSYTSSNDEYDFNGEPVKGAVIGPLHAALKNPYVWDVSDDMKSSKTLRDLQSMGIMRDKNELRSWDNLQQHHVRPFMAEMRKRGHDGVIVKTGHEHLPNGIAEVVAFDPKTIKHKDAEVFDPTDPRIRREDGGEVEGRASYGNGGKSLGLYSKAAQVIRNQPQAKGSVDQLLAMVSKTKGVKPAELSNAGRPAGDTMSKEELAKHFEDALPKVDVERIGGRDSNGFPQYEDYTLPGGENYREHLLHLAPQEGSIDKRRKELEDQYKNVSTVADLDRITSQINALSNDDEGANFKSSHWNTPNVLAHVRMSDRDNGKTLHVHEVQSDWGQEGRENGFHDPKKPFEVVNKKTKEVVSKHPDYSSMWDAYRTHPDSDNLTYGDVRDEKPPQAPYVGNTQQWTDLALKHIMAEAAKGGYERVVFSPGEANADLYGQRKEVSKLEFLKSNDSGESGILSGFTPNGYYSSQHDVESHADLPKLIGKENAANLLAQPPTPSPDKGEDRYTHTLQGPLQVGGHGMVDYYKNYVNQGAMKLLQQHDQSAKPESYDLPEGYKGFALPVTDTARDSILKNGFQAFKRGGEVHKADGGEVDGDGEFEVGKKYSGVIPQIKYLPVHAIERQPSQYEVSHVSDDVAKNMDFSEPVEATAFRYSSNNREDHPSVALQNGHHRLAAARQTGRPHLPVTLTAVNAKGEKLNALKALSDEIERGMISKATGGPVMGYVPMASLTVPRLAVARAPQYQQQQGGAGKFSDSLNSLMKTVEGFKKKPEADAAVESPSAASEGHPQLGMIAMPEDGYEATGMYAPFQSAIDKMIADAPGKITVASGYRTPERQEELWNEHAAKYPDPEVRDNYVARPGQSSHNYGLAADLSYADQEAIKWAQENAAKYGLNFRMGHENWHIEPSNIWELRNAMTVPGYATGGSINKALALTRGFTKDGKSAINALKPKGK